MSMYGTNDDQTWSGHARSADYGTLEVAYTQPSHDEEGNLRTMRDVALAMAWDHINLGHHMPRRSDIVVRIVLSHGGDMFFTFSETPE